MLPLIKRREFSALLAGATLTPWARAATVWRLATGYRPETFHTVNVEAMAKDVLAATGGEFRIEVHPNNALAKLNDIRAAVEAGKIEAGETIMSSLVGEIAIAGADSVPFIISSYADARRMWRYQRPLIERHMAKRGMQVLYAVPWPPQGLYSNRPVAVADDLRGSRMRTYNPTTVRIAQMLGAEPVDVPTAEVGQAFTEGRIDSMITSATTGAENQVWRQVRYFYDIKAWFPKNIVFANAAAMKALPKPSRDALLTAAAAAELRGWSASEAAASARRGKLARVAAAPRSVRCSTEMPFTVTPHRR